MVEITMQELIDTSGYMDELYDKDISYSIRNYPKKYKGFRIEYAIGNFGKAYYTAVNTKNNQHVHNVSEKAIYRICDCAYDLIHKNCLTRRYEHFVRNKAMRLLGLFIRS